MSVEKLFSAIARYGSAAINSMKKGITNIAGGFGGPCRLLACVLEINYKQLSLITKYRKIGDDH